MSTTLESLFTDIANAIRSKTGGTDPIPATSMAAKISSIPTGEGGGGGTESGDFDPASFQTHYISRFLAVSGDNVSFSISKSIAPTLPKLFVIPCVQDTDYEYGGSFVMVRDESLGYRCYFNGKDLNVYAYDDYSSDYSYGMTIYFDFENSLYTSCMDEMEKAMFWF